MRVFVAGATGVLGRRVVSLLVEAGHNVAGLSRSEANSRLLKDLGAEPRAGSLFDKADVIRASEGCDAIMHLATSVPTAARTRLLLAKIFLGSHAIDFIEASARCRNDAARRALGWNPAYPGGREGFSQVLMSRSLSGRS